MEEKMKEIYDEMCRICNSFKDQVFGELVSEYDRFSVMDARKLELQEEIEGAEGDDHKKEILNLQIRSIDVDMAELRIQLINGWLGTLEDIRTQLHEIALFDLDILLSR
jgi:hypothetical protein